MTTREAIRSLKAKIKQLGAEQRTAKGTRKGCPTEKMSDLWGTIWCRSARITAYLNVYHALRGSAFKHGIRDTYLDKKYSDEIMKEFAIEAKA